ncbi:DUF3995 domain-containing protein [Nocardiopsis sp. CC223A]|uniref:DUF3995 domain-containing protein n=1 Tax=Nocardiopsis sp. CC223A TaxID=3044051 RepID=UPI002795F306|nr:DUF3995 domain-containing protein [Nocardiopsis sp. CC223A]
MASWAAAADPVRPPSPGEPNDHEHDRTRGPHVPSRPCGDPRRPAYATFAWAFAFALISLYRAVGGEWLPETVGEAVTEPARSGAPAAVAAVWVSVVVKFAAAAAALGLLQRWGRWSPRWFLAGGGWLAAGLLMLYGGAGAVQQLLMARAGRADGRDRGGASRPGSREVTAARPVVCGGFPEQAGECPRGRPAGVGRGPERPPHVLTAGR